jgi:hypothetical protein
MSRSSIDIPVVSKFDPTGIKQAQTALSGFGKSLLSVGTLVAGAFAIRGIFNFGMEAIIAAERAQQFNDILVQVAKTTDTFGANLTGGTNRLLKFADAQELVIGVEAELIKETQAVLLSFKSVGQSADEVGGSFDRATMAAFDIAGVLKTDAKSAAVQLGKALENPIRGLTALGKAGTTFTDQQKEQIRVLVESGNLLGAQTLILDEIESQYGGVAEAAALGSVKIQLAFGQIQDALGAALAPAFQKFTAYFINEVVPPLTEFFEVKFPILLRNIGATFSALQPALEQVGDAIRKAFNISEENTLLEGFLLNIEKLSKNEEFLGFLEEMIIGFAKLLPDLIKLLPLMVQLAEQVIPLLLQLLPPLISFVTFLGDVIGGVAGMFTDWNFVTVATTESLDNLGISSENLIPGLGALSDGLGRIADAFRGAYERAKQFFDQLSRNSSAGVSLPNFGERANGGRVTGGMPYLVGEMGPELFMPGRGGNIVPNDQLGGGGTSIVINVTAGMGANGAQVGEQIVNAIKRYERTSGPVFASA